MKTGTPRSSSASLRFAVSPAVLALFLTLIAGVLGWLAPIDHATQDLRASLTRQAVASDLVIVEIDADSLRRLESWPWPRSHHARLLDQLRDSGAASIFYDVDFSSSSDPAEDRILADALAEFPSGTVMLPVFTQPGSNHGAEEMIVSAPLPQFRTNTVPVSVNIHPDKDGLVRRIAGSERFGDRQTALAGALMSGRHDAIGNTVLIDYAIDPGSFERLSFADVINGRFDKTALQGKHVAVGATAIELGDTLSVPVYASLPGVVVQAIAYQTLQRGGLQSSPLLFDAVSFLVLFVLSCVVFRFCSWRGGLVFLAVSLAAIFALALHAYNSWQLVVAVAPHVCLLLAGTAAFLVSRLEEQHLRLLLQAFDLRRKDRLMTSVVDSSIDGIVTISEQGIITSVNPAARSLFGLDDRQLRGRTISELLIDFPPSPPDGESGFSRGVVPDTTIEGRARSPDGGSFPVELALSRMDLDGEIIHTLIIRDISERIRHRELLQHQAMHDALTGLGNRYFLNDRLHEHLNREPSEAFCSALLVIDLDRFKEINDALGHGTGDRVLTQVAERFSECIAADAALARIGGDEFAIVMTDDLDARRSRELAERLLICLNAPFPVNGVTLEIGASIGIALSPLHARDPDLLMQHADTAMYVAKRTGSGLMLYQPEFAHRNRLRMTISTGLREALAENRLSLLYQPKLDVGQHFPCGAEALLRWRHPEFGEIPPEEIIDVAETTGLIWPLTAWTLGRALEDSHSWRRAGFPIRISVNLSARLLQDSILTDRICACLRDNDAEPDWLTLEITESAIMADPAAALNNAMSLHAAGIHLSIDDFGTGYSSLEYLKNLPASELKIDKSFVIDMLNEHKNALIVKSTIELAHNLGLEVVAEGVESAEILFALAGLDCDIAQGYHISPPIDARQFQEWLDDFKGERKLAAAAGRLPGSRQLL